MKYISHIYEETYGKAEKEINGQRQHQNEGNKYLSVLNKKGRYKGMGSKLK